MSENSRCEVCSRPSSQFLAVKHVGQYHICTSCRNNFYKVSQKMIQAITKEFKVFPTTEMLVKFVYIFLAEPKECYTKIKWNDGSDFSASCEQNTFLCRICKFRKSVFMFRLPDSKYKTCVPFCVENYGLIQREWFTIMDKVKKFKPDVIETEDDVRLHVRSKTEITRILISKIQASEKFSENSPKTVAIKENMCFNLSDSYNKLEFNCQSSNLYFTPNLQNVQHYPVDTNQEIIQSKHNTVLSKIQNTPQFVDYLSSLVNNTKSVPGVHANTLTETSIMTHQTSTSSN